MCHIKLRGIKNEPISMIWAGEELPAELFIMFKLQYSTEPKGEEPRLKLCTLPEFG